MISAIVLTACMAEVVKLIALKVSASVTGLPGKAHDDIVQNKYGIEKFNNTSFQLKLEISLFVSDGFLTLDENIWKCTCRKMGGVGKNALEDY